jgi:hypothetical protein
MKKFATIILPKDERIETDPAGPRAASCGDKAKRRDLRRPRLMIRPPRPQGPHHVRPMAAIVVISRNK